MGIGVSIFLGAVGAILTFAVEADVQGVNLNTVGVVLMIVAAIGLLVSSLFLASWAPFGRTSYEERTTTDEHGDVVERERFRRSA